MGAFTPAIVQTIVITRHKIIHSNTTRDETVNTVCLGFSHECSEFSQSWFYPWFLAKMKDFGGEDEGFLARLCIFW